MEKVNSLEELGNALGIQKPATVNIIPTWVEDYIRRIGLMEEALKEAGLPTNWIDGVEVFEIEKPSEHDVPFKRQLWTEYEEFIFGDDDHEYLRATSLPAVINRIVKWVNSELKPLPKQSTVPTKPTKVAKRPTTAKTTSETTTPTTKSTKAPKKAKTDTKKEENQPTTTK